jgi:protein involved in polysaccharide export with SLBB domain
MKPAAFVPLAILVSGCVATSPPDCGQFDGSVVASDNKTKFDSSIVLEDRKRIIVFVEGEVGWSQACSVLEGSSPMEAIRQAGGFTKYSAQRLLLVRQGPPGHSSRTFLIDRKRIEQNIHLDLPLESGDKIFVPRR